MTERGFSKERIKAEMREAEINERLSAILGGLLLVPTILLTWWTIEDLLGIGYGEVDLGGVALILVLWIATGGSLYGAIHYGREYEKWKSML